MPFVTALGLPLGLASLGAIAVGCCYARRQALLWTFVPFVAAHALVAHKEARFMNPMFYALLPLIALAVDALPAGILEPLTRAVTSRAGRMVVAFVWAANAAALVVATAVPVNDRADMLEWLWAESRDRPVTLYSLDRMPYYDMLPLNYYRPPGLRVVPLAQLRAADVPVADGGRRVLVLYEGAGDLTLIQPVPIRCRVLFRSPSAWLRELGERGWIRRDRVWSICEASPAP